MKSLDLNRKMPLILLAGALILFLTGCSLQIPALPGGSNSQVLESKIPRDVIDNIQPDNNYSLVDGNSAFSLDLYHQLRMLPGNLFYSPYSISSALAMTYAGAEGQTAEEMASVFHFSLAEDQLHSAFNALDQYLTGLADVELPKDQGDPFQLNIANAIWGQKDFHFENDFLDTLAINYGAGLRLLDYVLKPDESRKIINDWVSDETREKIQDLIPQGAINSDTRLVLSNAIYFKAAWLEPFEESYTEDGIFHGLDDADQIVQMMSHGSDPGLLYYRGEGFQAVALPYIGGQVSMLVLVPDAGEFSTFESGLSQEILDEVINGMVYTSLRLRFPKFEFESEISLANTLSGWECPAHSMIWRTSQV